VLWVPNAVDLFILPRTALVVGFGVLLPALAVALAWPPSVAWRRLGLPVAAVAAAALLAAVFSINPWLSAAGAYTRYESVIVRLAYLGLFAGTAVLCAGSFRAIMGHVGTRRCGKWHPSAADTRLSERACLLT